MESGGLVARAPNCQSRGGSIPSTTIPKVGQFRLSHFACLSEDTVKAIGPFCLVSMSGEVKDHTQGVNVYPVVDSKSGGLYL